MKNLLYLFLFLTVIAGCKKDEDKNPQTGDRVVKVENYDKVDVDGNLVVKVHYSADPTGEVRINSNNYDWSKVVVRSENGELIIHADDNIALSENIIIEIFVPVLTAIRLENTQQAIIYWDPAINIPALDIVTEAESRLEIYNLNATSVNSRQEATSDIFISSAVAPVVTPANFNGNVTKVDNKTIVVDGKMVVKGDSIRVNNTSPVTYTVYGEASSYNLVQSAFFRGEGKSSIDISAMPTQNLNLKLEGESKAIVWATNTLSGKGEGQSVLSYYGTPAVSYITSGSARIIGLR